MNKKRTYKLGSCGRPVAVSDYRETNTSLLVFLPVIIGKRACNIEGEGRGYTGGFFLALPLHFERQPAIYVPGVHFA